MRQCGRLIILLFVGLLFLAACGEDEGSPSADGSPTASIPIAWVIVGEARVFEYPSREAQVLFRLIEGDQTPILAKTEPDLIGVVWYQVGQKDQFGWLAGSQVEVTGDLSLVRTVDASVWSVTPSPEPETVTPTPAAVSDQVQATVLVAEAVVLDSPARTAPEVSRLFEGEVVDVLGRVEPNAQGDVFYFVGRHNFVLGWILASQVTLQGDITGVPLLEDANTSISQLLPTGTFQVVTEAAQALTPTAPPAQIATPLATFTPALITEAAPTIPPTLPLRLSPTPTQTPDLAGTAQAAPTATLVLASATPTLTQTGVAVLKIGEPPPLKITLPEGWQAAHILVPINSAYLQGELPVSVYQGNLSGDAKGTLWIIWGFPNVTSPTGEINLYGDGVQLLRGLLFDPQTCQIGLGNEVRQYKVGGLDAVGTIYSAINCANSSDIAGFFAVLQVDGGNFAFYVGVEPVTATRDGLREMQTLLDSVQFEGVP